MQKCKNRVNDWHRCTKLQMLQPEENGEHFHCYLEGGSSRCKIIRTRAVFPKSKGKTEITSRSFNIAAEERKEKSTFYIMKSFWGLFCHMTAYTICKPGRASCLRENLLLLKLGAEVKWLKSFLKCFSECSLGRPALVAKCSTKHLLPLTGTGNGVRNKYRPLSMHIETLRQYIKLI